MSRYSLQHCLEPLQAAWGGPLGQRRSIYEPPGREEERGERLLSIISSAEEQSQGKHEAVHVHE